jgi:hypothetical protein
MRGAAFCVAHRHDLGGPFVGADPLDERRKRIDRFTDLVRSGKHAELIDAVLQAAIDASASKSSLATEIGALRLMLQRVVATELLDGDLRETTQTMTRLVDAIIRALRMEQTLAASFEDDLRAAVTRAFADLELLEDR